MRTFIKMPLYFIPIIIYLVLIQPPKILPNEVFVGELRRIEGVMMPSEERKDPVSRGVPRTLMMEVTAYSEHYESCGKHPWEPGYGITASGERVRKGIVAADPKVLPLHSLIYVEGIGQLEVKDTGGAIKGNKLDLYLPSHKEAVQWGRKTLKVTIIRLGRGK